MRGRRRTSWRRLSQLREAGCGYGGGRERRRLQPAKTRERSRGLCRSPTPRRFWNPPVGGPHKVTTRCLDSGTPLAPVNPWDNPFSNSWWQDPIPPLAGSLVPSSMDGCAAAQTPPFAAEIGVANQLGVPTLRAQNLLPSTLAGSHLRGAPIAELIGDGLDAPGPGHRDVAALRSHVQPHHRHGRLAVRLRLGSGSASSGRLPVPPAAAFCPAAFRSGPRGLATPLTLRRTQGQPACQAPPTPRWQSRLADKKPREKAGLSLRGSLRTSGCLPLPQLAHRRRGWTTDPKGEVPLPQPYVSHWSELSRICGIYSPAPPPAPPRATSASFFSSLLERFYPMGGRSPENGGRCHGSDRAAPVPLAPACLRPLPP